MEQTLLDTFEGLKMTDRQKNLFAAGMNTKRGMNFAL